MGNTPTVITGTSTGNEKKTVIYNPGGESSVPGQAEGRKRAGRTVVTGGDTPYWDDRQTSTKKPLVGFLVSVSRTPAGEFWALRLGENTVGSANECSIMLNEAKVSEKHATLIIQVNEEENNRLNVWITGLNATNGTYLNKKLIPPQTAIPCNNNDKIKIGSYELLLMLFDANKHDMKSVENFRPKYESGVDDFSFTGSSDPRSTINYDPKGTRF